MARFRAASVDDPASHALLVDYFASRASTFPASMGVYRPAFPAASDLIPPAGVFLVLEDGIDGRVLDVGCGGIRSVPGGSGLRRSEVKHVWVDPVARGRGLGRMLLAELERRAAESGAEELVLDTNAAQEAAAHLYRSTGYTEIPAYNDNPNATHWFSKRLTPA
jgi:ribosomal protein S18 acetylase RimI-like enzyme